MFGGSQLHPNFIRILQIGSSKTNSSANPNTAFHRAQPSSVRQLMLLWRSQASTRLDYFRSPGRCRSHRERRCQPIRGLTRAAKSACPSGAPPLRTFPIVTPRNDCKPEGLSCRDHAARHEKGTTALLGLFAPRAPSSASKYLGRESPRGKLLV